MQGYVRTLEAVFAGIILIGFLVVLLKPTTLPETQDTEKAYAVLMELDKTGNLREYIVSGNLSAINSKISLFPYNHSVVVCDSSGCAGEVPETPENIWTGEYLISGYDSFHPYVVKLFVWEK